MKRLREITYYILLLFSFIIIFTSCDIQDAPYKKLSATGEKPTDEARTDTITVPPLQNVMIEDFTGWKCGNCPKASEIAHKLKESLGSRVVPIKVHVTEQFASPDGEHENRDFRNSVSNDIYNFFQGNALPNGLVNRKTVNNSFIIGPNEWNQVSLEILKKAPDLVIKSHAKTVNKDGKYILDAQVQLNYLKNGSLTDKVAVYIIEDSIKGVQKDYRLEDPIVEPYYHTEMLRGAITGTWGQEVKQYASESKDLEPKAGQKIFIQYQYELNTEWNPKNCSIITFVYDDKTKEIKQVYQSHVK